MGGPGSGRKPLGRPSTLSDEHESELVRLIRAGNYLDTAAALAGLHQDTVRVWMRKGAKAKRGRYREFFMAVKEAEAFAENSALVRLRAAGRKNWKAEAWYLERKFPAKWGRWERVTHDVPPEVGETRDMLARKDVRDLLDEAARKLGVEGDPGGDSE